MADDTAIPPEKKRLDWARVSLIVGIALSVANLIIFFPNYRKASAEADRIALELAQSKPRFVVSYYTIKERNLFVLSLVGAGSRQKIDTVSHPIVSAKIVTDGNGSPLFVDATPREIEVDYRPGIPEELLERIASDEIKMLGTFWFLFIKQESGYSVDDVRITFDKVTSKEIDIVNYDFEVLNIEWNGGVESAEEIIVDVGISKQDQAFVVPIALEYSGEGQGGSSAGFLVEPVGIAKVLSYRDPLTGETVTIDIRKPLGAAMQSEIPGLMERH